MFAKLKALIKSLKRQNAGPASPPVCNMMVIQSIQRDVHEIVGRALTDCQSAPHDRRPRIARLTAVCTPTAGQPDSVDIEVDARYMPPMDGMPMGRRPCFCDRSAN